HVFGLEELDFFTGYFVEWDSIGDKIASVGRKVGRVIEQDAAVAQVGNIAIVCFFVQANKYVCVIAHGFDGLIADAYLKHTRSTENFGWKGAEGIDMIPPACGTESEDITTGDGSFARFAANTNCYFIHH